MKTIRNHIGTNIVGYVALFVALSGSAYAATSIGPGDIRANAVRSRHIARNAVRSNDIQAKAVKRRHVDASQVQLRVGGTCPAGAAIREVNPDGAVACETDDRGGPPSGPAGGSLAGTYPNPSLATNSVGTTQIVDGAVTGTKIASDSLGGDQIVESSLGQVPSALLGGFGRTSPLAGPCNPTSGTYVTCASMTVDLPAASRALVIGRSKAHTEGNGNAGGNCALVTVPGGAVPNAGVIVVTPDIWGDTFPLIGVTDVLPAGPVLFAFDCNETNGDIRFSNTGITAVAMSPN